MTLEEAKDILKEIVQQIEEKLESPFLTSKERQVYEELLVMLEEAIESDDKEEIARLLEDLGLDDDKEIEDEQDIKTKVRLFLQRAEEEARQSTTEDIIERKIFLKLAKRREKEIEECAEMQHKQLATQTLIGTVFKSSIMQKIKEATETAINEFKTEIEKGYDKMKAIIEGEHEAKKTIAMEMMPKPPKPKYQQLEDLF